MSSQCTEEKTSHQEVTVGLLAAAAQTRTDPAGASGVTLVHHQTQETKPSSAGYLGSSAHPGGCHLNLGQIRPQLLPAPQHIKEVRPAAQLRSKRLEIEICHSG